METEIDFNRKILNDKIQNIILDKKTVEYNILQVSEPEYNYTLKLSLQWQ